MRTLERPTQAPGGPSGPRRGLGPVLGVLLGILSLPILVLLVVSKWGVLIAVLLAALIGLGLWTMKRGFLFIEIVAFLIHFDGVGVGPIRLGRITAVVAFGVVAYKLVVERWRPPAIPTRHWLPIMLLVLYGVLSGVWIEYIGAWFFAFALLGLALAYYAVSALLVDSHEKVMRYLRAFWVGGLFGSMAGVLGLVLGTRSVGFGGDPNYFGMIQATMIPLTVYYRRNARTPREKSWYTLALILVLAGAAGAGSRSGLIGGSIAIVGTLITRPRLSATRRAKVAVGAVLLAGTAFLIGFVANPNNLSRGFADRGAGRLDMWTATIPLIKDRPLLGHGFGQLGRKVLPSLTTSPGVEELMDQRADVSSHNTILDILGDLGIVGLCIWGSIFGVTILGFLRPRWRQTKEISTTMFVMMLPIASSSMFLPMINQKIAVSLVGMASALQVPSWGARWRGFSGIMGSGRSLDVVGPPAGGMAAGVPARTSAADPRTERPDLKWEPVVLARWDVKISRRFRYLIAAGAFAGLLTFSLVASFLPTTWSASADVILIDMSATQGNNRVAINSTANQVMDTIATSGAYAQTLKQLSGVDLTVPEVRDRVITTRTGFGAAMTIAFSDTDRRLVEQVQPHVLPAFDRTLQSSREASVAVLEDELRPIYPGEQRFDTSQLYLPLDGEASLGSDQTSRVWVGMIGALFGALSALAWILFQQHRPRVNNDDDLTEAIGLGVWSHVGRPGRRYGASPAQYAQVGTMATEMAAGESPPRRVVITTPTPDRAAGTLATGVAAAIAAEGRRVVLVDAQTDAPGLTRRLSWPWRSGFVDVMAGAPIDALLRRVDRWRLSSSARRTLGRHGDQMRLLPVGRRPRDVTVIRPEVIDRFGPDVAVVIMAPSLCSGVAVGALLAWADVTVLALVEGRTVTFDAEDAAAPIRTFATAPSGVVMLDV